MYYVVYPILYLISLLPLWLLYGVSNFARFLVFHVIKYRRDLVLSNLKIAFPEKTEEERIKIAKQFYLNFTDTFIESLKLISMSDKEFERRSSGEFDYINKLLATGANVNVMAAHQFNWEFGNLQYARHLNAPFVGIYMVIKNKILERIFLKFRARYGTILISAPDFKNKKHEVFSHQYVLALAADQNPGNAQGGYWMNFFGRPVPFLSGPAKGAVKNNAAVVFVSFHKIKRGHYEFRTRPITDNGGNHTPEELTALYRDAVEETIRMDPANYLWSHRRWKWEYKGEELVGRGSRQ